jgi:hypothetical protein
MYKFESHNTTLKIGRTKDVFGLAFVVAFVPKSQKPTKGPNLARSFFQKLVCSQCKIGSRSKPAFSVFRMEELYNYIWKNFWWFLLNKF